jgi:acyl-CoA synthetase (AMP-forming)/AMP-acid ligase II
MNAAAFLLEGKDPAKTALLVGESQYTYGDLERASSQVARHLCGMRLERGSRVILASDNSFFWVASYLGIMQAGLVCVPLPSGVPESEFGHAARVAEARTAFVQARVARKYREWLRGFDVVTDQERPTLPAVASQACFGAICSRDEGGSVPLPAVRGDELAALMFTSGSTGKPRGVMVSHGNIAANTESIIRCVGLSQSDRIMDVLPFHYCFGASLLHTHLRVGGSVVIESRFMYPEDVLQRMIDSACTGFAGVPSHFQLLLRASSLRRRRFPNLRYVQQAGGHLAPAFIDELRRVLPATRVYVMYGQTEATARLSCLAPEMLESKTGSIGKAVPGVTLRVMNELGEEVRPGEVGEIVAEGKNIALGYWRDPVETARVFRNGMLHTGDLAKVDQDGFIYVVDRAKDIIKCGGKRVSCQVVEDQLLECGELTEAAVIGWPDDVLGEAVKAFVVPRALEWEHVEESIRLFCKMRLPAELVPRQIVLLKALPKNGAGKVLKAQLKDWQLESGTLQRQPLSKVVATI